MNEKKISTYLGFARKMGKLSYGQTVLFEVQKKKCSLVLLDETTSDNSKKKYTNACDKAQIKYIFMGKDEIALAIGKPNVKVVCVKDGNMTKQILENLDR